MGFCRCINSIKLPEIWGGVWFCFPFRENFIQFSWNHWISIECTPLRCILILSMILREILNKLCLNNNWFWSCDGSCLKWRIAEMPPITYYKNRIKLHKRNWHVNWILIWNENTLFECILLLFIQSTLWSRPFLFPVIQNNCVTKVHHSRAAKTWPILVWGRQQGPLTCFSCHSHTDAVTGQ